MTRCGLNAKIHTMGSKKDNIMAIGGDFGATVVSLRLGPSQPFAFSKQRNLLDAPKSTQEIDLTPKPNPYKKLGSIAPQQQLVYDRIPAVYAQTKPVPDKYAATGGVSNQKQLVGKHVAAVYAETKNLPDPYKRIGGVRSQGQLIGRHIDASQSGSLDSPLYNDPAEKVLLHPPTERFNFGANTEIIIERILRQAEVVLKPHKSIVVRSSISPLVNKPHTSPPPMVVRDHSVDNAIRADVAEVPLTDPDLNRPVVDPTPRLFGVYA